MNKIIILIIVLLVAGGIYFFFFSPREQEQAPSGAEEKTAAIAEVSTSNTVPVIEQEIQATDLDNLDKEFADIEAEIEDALNKTQ